MDIIQHTQKSPTPRHFRASLKEEGNKKATKRGSMPHFHSHGDPREQGGRSVVHVPLYPWHQGRCPSSCQPHKMPGSCKEGKVFLCFTQRKAGSSPHNPRGGLSDRGCQPGHLLCRELGKGGGPPLPTPPMQAGC